MCQQFFALPHYFLICLFLAACDQTPTTPLPTYDEQADLQSQVNIALAKAREQNKPVLLEVGGNWCPHCVELIEFTHHQEEAIQQQIKASYVHVFLNVDKKNPSPVLNQLPDLSSVPTLYTVNTSGKITGYRKGGMLKINDQYDRTLIASFLKSPDFPEIVETDE